MKESLGMIGAVCLMGVCCAGPLLIGGLGAVGIGTIMGFISDSLIPLGAVLIVGGIAFLGYRSYKIRGSQNPDCCGTPQKLSKSHLQK